MSIEWIDQIILAVVIILVWRKVLEERFDKTRDTKTLARKLEQKLGK